MIELHLYSAAVSKVLKFLTVKEKQKPPPRLRHGWSTAATRSPWKHGQPPRMGLRLRLRLRLRRQPGAWPGPSHTQTPAPSTHRPNAA